MARLDADSSEKAPEDGSDNAFFSQSLQEARGGSPAALGRVFEACRRYLLFVANDSLDSDLRPKGGASDLVQETFFEAQKDFQRFTGTTREELLAWLKQILAHRVANNVRHYRHTLKRDVDREIPLDPDVHPLQLCLDDTQAMPGDQLVNQDEMRRLEAAIARLPRRFRQVLLFRTWERRSFAMIGSELNRTPDAARKLWSRAVYRLQRELRKIP